jgi:hypothetical protein
MQDNAGRETLICGDAPASCEAAPPSGPNVRMVAATATPMAKSVITVNAPLATDFSARSSVRRRMMAKNPAAASVSHIGNVGERQS